MRCLNTIKPLGNLSFLSWVAFVLLMSFGFGCHSSRPSCPARFFTDSLEWNVGVLTKSQPEYIYHIPLHNQGGEVLHIKDLRSGCSCLTLECPASEIAPNDAVILTAKLHTDQMAAQDPFVREIYLLTDADSAEVVITLTGALYR